MDPQSDCLDLLEDGEITDCFPLITSPGPEILKSPQTTPPITNLADTKPQRAPSLKMKRRSDGLPKEKGKFPKLEERLLIQKERSKFESFQPTICRVPKIFPEARI